MHRQTRETWSRIGGVFALIAVAAFAAGCAQEASNQEIDVAVVDSVLAELGGTATAAMERGTRWRLIASVGSGLPPINYAPEELPEPGSRGAGLLQVYCIQCHWLPSPKMHTAMEWPYLLRNMLYRAQTLEYRLGGPLTTGMVGDVVMAGLETAEYPTPEQTDSILSYLQRNAMPEAEPGELTDGPGLDLFMQKCVICHAPPSPRAHTAHFYPLL